jgi:hypothetical protein
VFITGTLAVRVVVLTSRGGGDRQGVRTTRTLLFVCVATALLAMSGGSVLPRASLAAAAPGLLLAVIVAARPPSPVKLRLVGWALVASASVAMVVLIAASWRGWLG